MDPNDSLDSTEQFPADFKGFVVGDERDERKAGKPVAVAINVNIHIKNGQQERSARVPIHEIPFLRRVYQDGTVTVLPGWVPGIDRRRLMKQSEFDEEVKRLSETYVRVTQSGKTDFAADILGATPTERKPTLQRKMLEVAKAWKSLEAEAIAKARSKFPERVFQPLEIHGVVGEILTAADFEPLIALVEPDSKTLDAIDLDAINADDLSADAPSAPAAGAADGDSTPTDPVADLLEAFVGAGFSVDDAQAIAGMAIEHQGTIPEDALLTRASLRKADSTLNRRKVALVDKVIEAHKEALKALAGA